MGEGESFGATQESAATGVQRAKQRDSRTDDQCRPALTSPRSLSANPPGRVGARALVRSQREDWGWQCEHSLKEAIVPHLAGRESGKSLELPKKQETFSFLFVSWCARRGD